MNAVEAALHARLTAGTALTSLLANGTASVYQDVASENALEPYVVFNKQAGSPVYVFAGVAYEDLLYQVRAVTRGPWASEAGTIRDAIVAELNDQELTVAGHTHLILRRQDTADRTEVVDGVRFTHRGDLYRVVVDPD